MRQRSMTLAGAFLVIGVAMGAGATVLLRSDPPQVITMNRDGSPAAAVSNPGEAADASSPGTGPRTVAGTQLQGAATLDGLDGLDVRPEEWTFLRDALLRERERQEAARMDPTLGGLEVLRRVSEYGLDPLSVLGSYASIRARIRVDGPVRSIAPSSDGTPVHLGEPVKDAVILEFGAGTFEIDWRSEDWMGVREGLRSLEIRGAGMDKTILTGNLSDVIKVLENGAFENLIVRDLTLDGGDRGVLLLNVRGRVSAVLENVRVRGWASGGYSAAIGVSGMAILGARGCEFLNGVSSGTHVLTVRGPSLAVFENCLFSNVNEAVIGSDIAGEAGSAVRLIDCVYENCAVVSRRMETGNGQIAFPVVVQGGRVALGSVELPEEKRRALWGARYLASEEGVVFGPGKPSCTLGELLAVLERVVIDPAESVHGIIFLGSGPDGLKRFGVRSLNRSSSARLWRVVGPTGVRLEKQDPERGRGGSPPKAARLEAMSITHAIRTTEIPQTTAAHEARLVDDGGADGEELGLEVATRTLGWPSWSADPSTGKVRFKDGVPVK